MLRRLWRVPLVFLLVLSGIIVALIRLRPQAGSVVSPGPMVIWSRILCRLIGVKLVVSGLPRVGPTLFVANHISWLDIFCICAVCPSHFLAKREVADWPLFGWLARRAGTAFIRRGSENGAGDAGAEIAWRLRQGERMVIFPEGTSTRGDKVKRFYPRLFQAAILARCPVQAIALRYPHPQGVNPVVPFIDDDEFLSHLWRLLGERRIIIELTFAEPLSSQGQSRDSLALQTHAQISAVFQKTCVYQAMTRRRATLP
jgi:1-acyl-sn-glycerol-3-phosphate acyltransferase